MKRIYYTHAMHKHIFPKLRFFFRIKRQTRTHSKKSTVTICVLDGSERACVCLTHTQHVHIMYTISAQKYVFACLFAHCVNLRSVTTHVCVGYMFNKHVHALKSLEISTFTGFFRACTCLTFNSKKITLSVISFAFFPALQFHSYTTNVSKARWDLHRLWYGFATESERIRSEGELETDIHFVMIKQYSLW